MPHVVLEYHTCQATGALLLKLKASVEASVERRMTEDDDRPLDEITAERVQAMADELKEAVERFIAELRKSYEPDAPLLGGC